MRLGELLSGVRVIEANNVDVEVRSLTYFAHKVVLGGMYVACDLSWMRGYDYLNLAISRGASVIVTDRPVNLPIPNLTSVVVENAVDAYSVMCANYFNNVHRRLNLYAVTGTKGKTTTCHLLESIFARAGIKTGLISTIHRKFGGRTADSGSTTPDPFELHSLLSSMWASGVSHVIVEVSSIGVAERRILGLRFNGMIFTNLGREHLEYHGDVDRYWTAKSLLFTDYTLAGHNRSICVINVDDPYGVKIASVANGDLVTVGMNGDLYWTKLVIDRRGIHGDVCDMIVRSSLLGRHNADNILGAVALCRKMGLSNKSIADGISSLSTIPGRLERLINENGMDVYIDYAHTPESVEAVLLTLRRIFNHRPLVAVLGCGGNSDRSKRPVMARVAAENSDVCIFTSDNPRSEDPMSIINDMLGGIDMQDSEGHKWIKAAANRREAISQGLEHAAKGAVLVILGRGHERYQIVGNQKIPFDDKIVASEVLQMYSPVLRSGDDV
jgi:UDP-N-acetylmuramyl-tripeptide synthetase